MKKVVTIGGGTGLSTLLKGLRNYPIDITAVVTMTDNGASSGRLRNDLKIIPPGDIRQCIAALSNDETFLLDLFKYRFKKGIGLKGHSLGNLFIGALEEMTGNFESAVEAASRLLSVKGQVLPATLEDVHLKAVFENKKEVIGQTRIIRYGYKNKINRLGLTKRVKANPVAIKALEEADVIIIGPGSLYTSLIPSFLIKGIFDAYQKSKALKIYVCNVSTERGETEGFTVESHIETLSKYGVKTDLTLVNSKEIVAGSGDGYIFPVKASTDEDKIFADLVNEENFLFHDSAKLASAIWKIILGIKKLKRDRVSSPK